MKKKFYRRQVYIFALSLSIIIHAILFSLIINQPYFLQSMILEDTEGKREKNEYDYIILVDNEAQPEEKVNEETQFVSDRNTSQYGFNRPSSTIIPNNSVRGGQNYQRANTPNNNQNNANIKQSQYGDVSIYSPEKTETKKEQKKVPSSFNEASERALVFSSETGRMQLGTRAMDYYWYFKNIVVKIGDMWRYTIPNQAHYMGLIRSDDVEILLSIDEEGKIEFVDYLKRSSLGQQSLDNSCMKAAEYAGNVGTPPETLMKEYGENGKIYIPFRFIYQNFRNQY